MFNLPGAGELIVILVIALIVLGPDKLPDAVRKAGKFYGELRRMSSGFQAELRDALDEPMREIRSTTDLVRDTFTGGTEDNADAPPSGDLDAVAGDRPTPLPPPASGAAVTSLPPPPAE